MKTNTNKKHIINPEQIGVKKVNSIDGYNIMMFTRFGNGYWGSYCVMVDNIGFEMLISLYGKHKPIHIHYPL